VVVVVVDAAVVVVVAEDAAVVVVVAVEASVVAVVEAALDRLTRQHPRMAKRSSAK